LWWAADPGYPEFVSTNVVKGKESEKRKRALQLTLEGGVGGKKKVLEAENES